MTIRDQIREAALPEEIVPIPEWGINVLVRGLMAKDAMELGDKDGPNIYAQRLLSLCCRDQDGNRIYPTMADAAELMEKSLPIVQRLLEAANRVNGMDAADVKKG